MDQLRALYRAARQFYLDCQGERLGAEALAASLNDNQAAQAEPLRRARRALVRETAMRGASLELVRRINPSDPV